MFPTQDFVICLHFGFDFVTANILLDVEGTEQVLVIVSNHMHVMSESEVHDGKGPEKGMGMGSQGL